MNIIDMPDEIAERIANQNLWLRGRTGTAGKGVSNREQILFTENRIWQCPVDLVTMPDSLRLTARLFAQRLNGRVNVLRMPVCNRGTLRYFGDDAEFYTSAGISPENVAAGSTPFFDGERFEGGAGFALPDTAEPTVSSAVFEGDTQIKLAGAIALNLEAGARFSINGFLYQVEENDRGNITFAPPLREDVAAGAEVKVSEPEILMRLAADDGYEPYERLGRFVEPTTMVLEEEFQRA